MNDPSEVAPDFIEMAHRIVCCTAASIGRDNRPRSRILHPLWAFDDGSITGWTMTEPTSLKRAHFKHSPALSLTYWTPKHDHCIAECATRWLTDVADREATWERFKHPVAPVGFNPVIIPAWADSPRSERFGVIQLRPWRLRVFPAAAFTHGDTGAVLTWQDSTKGPSR